MVTLFGVFGIIIYIFMSLYDSLKANKKVILKLREQYADASKYKGIVKSINKKFVSTTYEIEFEYQGSLIKRKALGFENIGYIFELGEEVDVYYDGMSLTDCAFTDFTDIEVFTKDSKKFNK